MTDYSYQNNLVGTGTLNTPETPLTSKNQSPQLEAIKQALDAAAIALPVLFNMCAAAKLRAGAMAADEILGSVKFAQKEMAHLLSGATSAPETKPNPASMGIDAFGHNVICSVPRDLPPGSPGCAGCSAPAPDPSLT